MGSMQRIALACAIIALSCSAAIAEPVFSISPVITKRYTDATIVDIAFSPDRAYFASVNKDNSVKMWNPVTGALMKTMTGHSATLRYVSVSPDGKQIASASIANEPVKIWDAATGTLVRDIMAQDGCMGIAFSPAGGLLATCGGLINEKNMAGAILWDTATGARKAVLMREKSDLSHPTSLSFSRDGKFLAVGLANKKPGIRVFDTATGKLVRAIAHGLDINAVDFSPDGAMIAGGGGESGKTSHVYLWNAASGKLVRTIEGHTSFITSVRFSPDGRLLASGSFATDTRFRLWDPATGALVQSMDKTRIRTHAVHFSPDGSRLAAVLVTYGNLGNPPVLEIYEAGGK